MKKLLPFIVIALANILTFTNIYGQTLKMQTPQLSDFNVQNYLPKLGSVQIKDNNATEKIAAPGPLAKKLLALQSQKGMLVTRNNYFDVYKLPIDGMPCVVPSNSICYKMNSPKMDYNAMIEPMPNSMQQQNWIPEKLKKESGR
ncbi:hypothetical protein [Pinibacter aurantiacus]|uniref:Uncharacterized protein n=1 Tax=Pinibacter aurantiacus TaxID=2851599 RepID=A0A9E2W2L9_9BACT|nr:hypothetical protein [Pinibacter aurantiacus]MBV4357480.1 hypothetical protein [Pinibacter aurantiacus]